MRKLATIRRIDDIQPIEGADMIELAVVDGWKCVIKKNDFSVGDSVIYCEIDSFLPVRDEFEFLRKSSFNDEERIQNLASDYASFAGREFYVSEKLDGTSLTAFLDDDFRVCGRNWQYAEDSANSYWQAVTGLGLREKMEKLGRRIAIQGELVGPSIQSNRYKLTQRKLFVFNVFDIENYGYLDKEAMNSVCESLGLEMVPFIENREVPGTMDEILELAQGKSVLNAKAEREGLVWVSGSAGDRISFKTISNKFLAKYGD